MVRRSHHGMTDARAAALRAVLAVLAPTLVDIEFARLAAEQDGVGGAG